MRSNAEPIIRLRDARLGYRRETVLEAVNLEIAAGESWFVLGRNGSGKTTLLRTILGLIAPLSGEVWRSPERAALSHVGFVPQLSAVSGALPTTLREFVSLGTIGLEGRRRDRAADLAWALGRVGLASLGERSYWSLSGGQRRRALLARALVRRPGLLVLDEPTEGLDVGAEHAFLRTLDDLSGEVGATLLVVTHRLDVARRHASHGALIHAGRVLCGVRERVLTAGNVERFLGRDVAEQLAHEVAGP